MNIKKIPWIGIHFYRMVDYKINALEQGRQLLVLESVMEPPETLLGQGYRLRIAFKEFWKAILEALIGRN